MHRLLPLSQAGHPLWPVSPGPLRQALARWLRRLSATLRWQARLLSRPAATPQTAPPDTLPQLEFHGEAGAPEGALYVNGEYVGRLDVPRL